MFSLRVIQLLDINSACIKLSGVFVFQERSVGNESNRE